MVEIWKDIPHTDGQYQVSNLGNVRSLFYHSRSWNRIYRTRLLKQKMNPSGYHNVSILINKKRVTKDIHKIIAQLFVPNPENKPQVNHIDGNKSNNSVSNLEWVTAKENNKHAIETGLRNPHALSGCAKPRKQVAQYDLSGELINVWDSVYDAASYYGIKHNCISSCANGYNKSYHKYMWKYITSIVPSKNIEPYTNNTGTKQIKHPVNQIDIDGTIIKKWESDTSVAQHYGCSTWKISHLCKTRKIGFGSKWEFSK